MSHETISSPIVRRRHVLILPLIEQYREKIDAHMQRYEVQPNGCWNWTGAVCINKRWPDHEYGTVSINKKTKLFAHRLAYAYYHGVDPAELVVRHSCDNSLCICKDHLLLGTSDDNMADMKRRGRSTHGEKSTNARLTEREVIAITRLLPTHSNKAIAEMIGHKVTDGAISSIRTGKTWQRVTGITPQPHPKEKAA